MFLTPSELAVFERWDVPVRYIRKWKPHLGETCRFCNRPAETAAHKIPYRKGILEYHLTPAFLNRWSNLVATCRACNRRAEWSDSRIRAHLRRLGARAGKRRSRRKTKEPVRSTALIALEAIQRAGGRMPYSALKAAILEERPGLTWSPTYFLSYPGWSRPERGMVEYRGPQATNGKEHGREREPGRKGR